MRTGGYAVFEGVTHRARITDRRIHLIVPDREPQPDGWERYRTGGYWLKTVPRPSVSRLYYVRTMAVLDGLAVGVINMDEAAGTALVCAHAPYPGSQPKLHPDLRWVTGNASTEWAGTVAIDRLTHVDEPEYEIEVDSRHLPEVVWFPPRPR